MLSKEKENINNVEDNETFTSLWGDEQFSEFLLPHHFSTQLKLF